MRKYFVYDCLLFFIFLLLKMLYTFQNEELSAHVEKLQDEKKKLLLENDRLQEEIRCLRNRCTLESKTGSAESHVFPLPKGHSSRPVTSSNPLVIQLVFLQMIIYIGFLKASTISRNSMNWSRILSHYQITRKYV